MNREALTDFFGISNALQTAALVYFQTSRRTGRTTQMVEAVKTGDRVIFASEVEKRVTERLLKERGVEITCVVVLPENPHQLFELGTSQGRTFFDHVWLERYYNNTLRCSESQINEWRGRLSGYDVRHRETRAKYTTTVPQFHARTGGNL